MPKLRHLILPFFHVTMSQARWLLTELPQLQTVKGASNCYVRGRPQGFVDTYQIQHKVLFAYADDSDLDDEDEPDSILDSLPLPPRQQEKITNWFHLTSSRDN
jgi:hypothetical protein